MKMNADVGHVLCNIVVVGMVLLLQQQLMNLWWLI